MAKLGDKAVGDIVKIKENGTAVNYIIVQKGLPSSMYDSSCDGVWLLREKLFGSDFDRRPWDGTKNDSKSDYENSDIKIWLNGEYLNTIDSKIRAAIKTVKIPFKKGVGNASTPVQSGSSGLSCKVFLLSGYEVGFTQTNIEQYDKYQLDGATLPIDGAKLSYFSNDNSRIAQTESGDADAYGWWLRSPWTNGDHNAWNVAPSGIPRQNIAYYSMAARPAFILPSSLLVDSNGMVLTNTPPTISGSSSSGTNLGNKSVPFNFTYTVNDADNNTVTVKEYLDNVLQRSYTATLGVTNTFQAASNLATFQNLSYASHTIKIVATDSAGDSSADYVVYFSKVNSVPTITSDKTGNLGTLTNGFTCKYSVNDADPADSVKVTLAVDSTNINTFTAVKGQQYTYTLSGNDWLKITSGSHTFKISATDGKDTANSMATFSRSCNKLTTTLENPLTANDIIKACTLKIEGSIPSDAVCKYEVTNNGNDTAPVWEDCTQKVKTGFSYMFKNKTAVNGFAFNFRITIQRGASNAGGYIERISGGFE